MNGHEHNAGWQVIAARLSALGHGRLFSRKIFLGMLLLFTSLNLDSKMKSETLVL